MVGIASTHTESPEAAASPDDDPPARAGQASLAAAAAPSILALGLLFVAAWSGGAFQLRSWGPLAIFALVALAATRYNGVRGAAPVSVLALGAFAAWSLLSVTWSPSPGNAPEAAGRTILYAALFALPVLTVPTRTWAVRMGWLVTAAAAGIVLLTFLGCLANGEDWFLAGRLDDPIGYRNGTAALFALVFWPLVAVAAQRRVAALVRAACFGLGAMALGFALMTESRGVVLGFACGGLVAVAAGPDRLRRAWLTILALGGVALAAPGLQTSFDSFRETRATSAAAIETSIQAAGYLGAGAFAVMLALALLDGGLRGSQSPYLALRIAAGAGLVVLALGAGAAGLAAIGDPVAYAGDKVEEFKDLEPPEPGEQRLGSTSGQRYDLWRIAWAEFESAPVRGVGEGAYPVEYYVRRATDRNLTDPHSLPLRVLAETGLVGALLLAGALVAAFAALATGWRGASADERRWASALAAAAAVALGQSVVDWFWLIPGLTGLGFVCLGTAVAVVSIPRERVARARPWALLRLVPVAGALVLVALLLSDTYTRTARAELDPAARLRDAERAETLNPYATAPRYLQAGALERLGRAGDAREELRAVLDRAPGDFVALGLLGDLETRAGNERRAREHYREALERNPRDVGLQQLAGRP